MTTQLSKKINRIVRSGVSGLVFKMPERRILLIERENHPNKGVFCFPGGTQEFGETLMEATHREIVEETGHLVKQIDGLNGQKIRPWVEEIQPDDPHSSHWIIHCALFDATG